MNKIHIGFFGQKNYYLIQYYLYNVKKNNFGANIFQYIPYNLH